MINWGGKGRNHGDPIFTRESKIFYTVLCVLIVGGALLLMFSGCTTAGPRMSEVSKCINQQVDLYGDICRESQVNFEGIDSFEAHRLGVECAVESINICIDGLGL
jgi:hypothetical protein